MAEQLRLYQFLPVTHVEGPGLRAGVWVQGCPIHCKGCAVPQTWDFSGGLLVDVATLAARILAVPGLEGVTFAGGEPFAQAEGLAALGKIMQQAHKSVLTFTGYTWKELKNSKSKGYKALLKVTDLLIAGPFEQSRSAKKIYLAGSDNQEYHFLTTRYAYLQKDLPKLPNKVEIHIMTDGSVVINGMMPGENFYKILSDIPEGDAE